MKYTFYGRKFQMRIIKSPNRVTCDKCGCIFEFGQSDVNEITKVHREDVGIIFPIYKTVKYHVTYVECPICGYQHEIAVRSSY